MSCILLPGLEQVHDAVEQSLLKEVAILRGAQDKFRNMLEKVGTHNTTATLVCISTSSEREILCKFFYHQVRAQSKNCRATQHELETDMRNKEYALGIDSMCHQLNNFSKVRS